MKIHKSITRKLLLEAVERAQTSLDNPGFCIACGNEQDCCEIDAQEYECDNCGEHQVYSAKELLFRGF